MGDSFPFDDSNPFTTSAVAGRPSLAGVAEGGASELEAELPGNGGNELRSLCRSKVF